MPLIVFQERALLISTWVDIAQELRLLKNFSSLKAIISGLQSNSVYRLSKTWSALCKEKVRSLLGFVALLDDHLLILL
jgi:ral guanine nucleotide dissociation stimulator-like 1